MTFRFGEEAQNASPKLHNPKTEEIQTIENAQVNKRPEATVISGTKKTEKTHQNIIPMPLHRQVPPLGSENRMNHQKERTGHLEQSSPAHFSDNDEGSKKDAYYGNPIYDDWGEPFGPYVSSSVIEKNVPISSVRGKEEDNSDHDHDLNWQHSVEYPEITSEQYSVHHRRSPGGWKLFGSVTAAIITGVLFGFVAMSMLNSGSENAPQPTVKETAGAGIASSNETVKTQTPVAGISSINKTTVSIPGVTYFMLQYGVFSTAEGATQAKNELAEAGIAAGSDPLDEARVYAGVSSNREEAKLISNQMKTEGVDLYVREITLPAVSDVVFTGDPDVIGPFFENSRALTDMLTSISIGQIGQQVQVAVPKEKISELADAHQRFTSNVGAIQAGLSENGKKVELKMESSMSTAISAVSEYNKNPTKEHMWKVQSAVMDYILQEKQLLEVMKQT